MFHPVCIKPPRPLLQIIPRPHSVCNWIPPFLRCSLFRHVAHFDDQLGRLEMEHLGEELVFGSEVVVLGQGCEGEDLCVEVVRFLD